MSLKTMLRALATERGLEIDEDELEGLGLSDDEDVVDGPNPSDVLDQELPGTAAGRVELFLGADSTKAKEPIEKDDLMWYPIIRSGQWAVRPGTTGKKRRVPLKVVAGKSKNQRKEIGLEDLLSAHEDEAIQHVTVPSSHNNDVLENQGYVDRMKIVDGQYKDQKTKKMADCKVLMGGYRITEPDTKGKIERGTIANRSAGILYDYVNTETGKSYPAVIEHVALTNKPWITGMVSFGRKLAASVDTVGLSLSDVGPDEDEYALILSDEAQLDAEEKDFLAQEAKEWSKEGSPAWLRQQVNRVLEDARQVKRKALQAQRGSGMVLYEDCPPHYRCVEAKPGMALVSDDYNDDANFWSAPISVVDGAVVVEEFTKWTALKKAMIPDERPAPPANKLPLDQQEAKDSAPPKSRLELAQEARKSRVMVPEPDKTNDTREVVEHMAGEDNTLLSEEAQKIIQAAEARAKAAEERETKLSERIARLTGTVQAGEVDSYIAKLKDPEGLALSEENGFGGVLIEVRELMLACDGEPAVQSDHFAQDDNKSGELSLSDAIKRIFGALEKSTEGKKSLGEQLSQPADESKDDAAGEKKKGDELSTSKDGKPKSEDPDADNLSTEDKVDGILAASPELQKLVGRRPIATGGEK